MNLFYFNFSYIFFLFFFIIKKDFVKVLLNIIFYYIGDFVFVEFIEEGEKVKVEIISILYKD